MALWLLRLSSLGADGKLPGRTFTPSRNEREAETVPTLHLGCYAGGVHKVPQRYDNAHKRLRRAIVHLKRLGLALRTQILK
eukprot:1064349-Pleurochrysis_carterae.AAC.1